MKHYLKVLLYLFNLIPPNLEYQAFSFNFLVHSLQSSREKKLEA